MDQFLFAPWLTEGTCPIARVHVAKIKMQHPLEVYDQYDYTCGTHAKLNTIPRHLWGRGEPNQSFYRIPRLVQLVDATGCAPVPRTPSHHRIRTIRHCDHSTYWLGPDDEPLILTEPYWPTETEIQAEIFERNLTAIVLPAPGVYAGGHNYTQSVLMGLPEHKDRLQQISTQIHSAGWPTIGDVVEMDWANALKLSKQQAQEVTHG